MILTVDGLKPQQAFAEILGLCLSDCVFMSDHAIRDWIRQAFNLVSEAFSEGKGRAWVTRCYTSKAFASTLDRLSGEKLRTYLFNLYLGGEGLSHLSGFGYASYEKGGYHGGTKVRNFRFNPEIQSTYLFERQI